MRKFARDRRRLLKNSIKSAAALPFLQHLPSLAASTTPQKRFIMMFTPNGTIPEEFFPSGSENQFDFKRILAPLESVKSEINVYKGLDNKLPLPGDDHQRGMGGLWTARHLLPGDTPDANGLDPVGWASGVSVDQVIAQQIGGQSRFKSLEYGVACGTPDIFTSR